MNKIPEKFKNFFWGENKLFFPDEEFVIKLSYPRIFLRYNIADGYFSSFEEFFNNIAEVQYLDGEKANENEHKQILTDIWNYISLEERILENDISDIQIDDYLEDEYE